MPALADLTHAISLIPGGCWFGGGNHSVADCPGTGSVDGCWCKRRVVAVLEGLREPSEEMVEAVVDSVPGYVAAGIWRAMIDVVLGEAKP